MFEEDVATLNGHLGSSVLAPTESAGDAVPWPVHEEIWAPASERSGAAGPSAEETEDMSTGTAVHELETFEDLVAEDPQPELSPFGEATSGGPSHAGSADEQGAQEESALETDESGAYEESAYEEIAYEESGAYEESPYENGAYEETAYENGAYEETAYEEDGALASVHRADESAYEDTAETEADEDASSEVRFLPGHGYEQTGYEQTGYEQTGYEDAVPGGAVAETEETPFAHPGAASEVDPEVFGWSEEVLAEDWAAGGEGLAPTDLGSGTAEDLAEEGPSTRVPAGERTVSHHPVLRGHRGTQPDLVVRWTAMPRSTTAVDVVVHLHGYSAAGARMRIQDKAAASGLDLTAVARASGGRRPVLGLVPRGSYFGGTSGAGYSFPQLVAPGGLQRLVASGLDLLAAQTGVRAKAGRLVLTAHSGGGAPLNAILSHTDPDEVHLFDGSYGDLGHVVAWARRRLARGPGSSALRVLFRPGTATARHALALAAAICPAIDAAPGAAALHRRFRVEATSVEHNLIPRTFGPLLLADAGADLPGAVRQGCAPRGRRTAGPPRPAGRAPSGPGGPAPRTSTPDRVAGVVKVTPYTKDGTRALPGAVALASQWRRLTGRVAGTFNARNTSFGTRSLHSEGRAIDCHGHATRPDEAAQAEAYIRWLVANAVELQVSTIIWDRRIWSWPRRAQGWRSYMTAPNHNPHTDHFHVDLSWEGALHPSPLFAGGVPGLAGAAAPSPSGPTPSPTPRPGPSAPPAGSGTAAGVKRSPREFVRLFGPYARASEARTGVPGLVTLAQAAVESGWGARAAGNNFFGIKARASDAPGTRQLWRTREVLNRPDARGFPEVVSVTPRPDGRYDYVVKDWFRVFPSAELAFVGHGEFLRRNKRYAAAFTVAGDPYRFAAEVARAGYATDPGYTKVVHSVMRLLERSGWT